MNKRINFKFYKTLLTVSASFCFGLSASVLAAPGKISDVPLNVGVGVSPNVLYVLDDSGSMVWEVLKTTAAESSATGYPETRERADGPCTDRWGRPTQCPNENVYQVDSREVVDTSPQTKQEMLEACIGYNATAFNPNFTYVPWTGEDASGVTFADQSTLAAVHEHPYIGGFTDLTGAGYVNWVDADNDGEFDRGECGENTTAKAVSDDSSNANFVQVSTLTLAEKTNYANWYTYYRKRVYALKAALSGILSVSEQRVGLATINNDSNAGYEVADMTVAANKEDIMLQLFKIKDTNAGPTRFTPLKKALLNAGKYFNQGQTPDFGFVGTAVTPASPLLSTADGGACQQNYTVMMTDGFYRSDIGDAGVGNADGNNNTDFDGDPYGDNESNTLADIAMHYYEIDLDNNLTDSVSSNNPQDTNDAQHMVTYAVAFGVSGNIDIEGDDAADPFSFTLASNQWPTSIAENSAETIDDLFHATFNGRGAFFNAANPEELLNDLISVQTAITANAAGSAAAVGVNSTNVTTNTVLFQSFFDSVTWEGELRAISYADGVIGGELWEASDELATRNFSTKPRNVITFNGVTGLPFRAPDDYTALSDTTLSQQQVNDLLTNSPFDAAANDDNQNFLTTIINFLRADATDADTAESVIVDGTTVSSGGRSFKFRTRGDRFLGDIVNSSPVFVGEPSASYPNFIEGAGDPYQDFVDDEADRDPMVYVGSNDGMLHAFFAPSPDSDGSVSLRAGDEYFAYMPGLLFSDQDGLGLHELTEDVFVHLPFVDSTPTARDVYINNDWRTYLVGGFGGGGKGVYVLDITNPSLLQEAEANAASIVKFEFSNENLGYTVGRPQIAKLNNGRWAAIFGNGYNNTGSGQASLFILYLDTDTDDDGNLVVEFKEISTEVGEIVGGDCLADASDCNGLSAPTLIDFTADAKVDRVYAGDVHGNMWAFDLSSENEREWEVAHQKGSDPAPLFTACNANTAVCAKEDRQPITVKPVIVGHPTERALATEPNLIVLFGTGQYLVEGDTSVIDNQSFYGIWDAGDDYENFDTLRSNDLQEQTIGTLASGNRTLSENEVSYSVESGGDHGWFMNLIAEGERVVVNPLVVGKFVIFATNIPEDNTCSGGSSGFLMAANIVSGALPDVNVFVDVNEENVAGIKEDVAAAGIATVDSNLLSAGIDGLIKDEELKGRVDEPSRRSSWSVIR